MSAALARAVQPGPVRTVLGFALAAVVLLAVAPAVLSQFRLDLLAKYLTFAIVAVGIGLAWGRGGMLTLGQGLFFGLGAYSMGMYLKLAQAGPGELPDFMALYGTDELPAFWKPFESAAFALLAVVLLPMAVAALLGTLVFRRRVKGPYFAILSQALVAAFAVLIVGSQRQTGGTNGLTNITVWFGYDLDDPVNRTMLYYVTAGLLLVVVAIARQLMVSRWGELLVAVRDAPERVRFLGYDPATVQTVAFTVAAGMAGVGGAMFTSVMQAINPVSVDVVASIGFVIGVAVGGRATLLGPPLGAVAVAWLSTAASEALADRWTYVQGALFIVVVAFLPNGIASLPAVLRARSRRTPQPQPQAPAQAPGASGADVHVPAPAVEPQEVRP